MAGNWYRFKMVLEVDCENAMKFRALMLMNLVVTLVLLSGCQTALFVAGLAVSSPLSELAADRQRQSDEYVANVFARRTPIIERVINDPVDGNGLCIFELAIQRNRLDVAEDAIKAGARPEKCAPNSRALREALRDLRLENVQKVKAILERLNYLKSDESSAFVADGITSGNIALIQLGLDLGAQINGEITMRSSYAKPYVIKPLLLAIERYHQSNRASVEVLRFVVASGAQYDSNAEILVKTKEGDGSLRKILEDTKR